MMMIIIIIIIMKPLFPHGKRVISHKKILHKITFHIYIQNIMKQSHDMNKIRLKLVK